MRLHLPLALRRALYLAISSVAVTVATQTAEAAVLFDGVGLQTYADFGQNCGRYVAGEVNAMLQAIRERDNGIVITYQSDSYKPYTISLEQGMIDFSSASSTPVDAAVGYGFLATVAHNGVLNPTYTANSVGGQNAVHYSSIDFKRGTNFHMEAATDYKVSRLNKLVTDAQPSELYSGANPRAELDGKLLYRTGSGAMELALIDDDGVWRRTQELEVPYTFATGGIVVVEWAEPASHEGDHDANFGIFHHVNPKVAEEIAAQPLPYRVRSGDSGSPTWVWNPDTKTYQYISAAQSGGQYFNQDRGDLEWSKYSMEKFNVTPDLGTSGGAHTITINPVTEKGDVIEGVGDTVEISTTPYSGTITYTDVQGAQQNAKFIGIQQGKHTWLDLSPVKDQVNWFNYGDAYFNAAKYGADSNPDKQFSYADLFVTNSLVFKAADSSLYNVALADDVDLGIGFVQFSKADGVDAANFKLQSGHLLESAGFAIDEGVTLELDMKAKEDRMVEWRKAGAGNLKITGSGDTNALLNVGGSGTVSLKRENGYAAYNVLASSGSTVVIDNLQQVYRDVTLGANGATLDLNGNDFTWNNSAEADGNGFKSLHLLMEKDIVTNTANKAVTITITDPGTEAFVGAFRDTKEGAINVEYNGNSENPWVMNTVFTNLQNNAASSFTVNQGGVILQGINTIHGRQVLGKRPVEEFDWHYADAQMDVVISSGAEFTLGSHARLTGDVTVEGGGAFTMTEYTTHQYEYVEGGVKMDDTYKLRAYYGLHGNINLRDEDSMFYVQFNPQHHYQDTDSQSVYDGKITGAGSMMVDTAGGSLKLTNAENDFTGSKDLVRGTLVATSKEALGNTTEGAQWAIYEAGVLQVTGSGAAELLPSIDGTSNGVLALTQDETGDAPGLSGHQDLIIGAVGDIQFGQKGTQNELAANDNNEWHLGGGGGNLYVNYKLNNDAGVLVLGNQYTTGRVILTNSGNHFSSIELKGGVTLSYETTEALGGASLSLNYGNRILGDSLLINQLTKESNGVVLIDNMSTGTIDLSGHGALSLAADKATTFTGSINLGEHDTYHFGGGSGHLVLDTDLTNGPGGARRNILVDAQFFTPAYADAEDFSSAGVVELTRVSQATGTVTVQGYDSTQIPDPDDPLYILTHFSTATLQLSVDNALVNAESILLKDGGFIDINGTSQTLHSLKNDYPGDVLHGAYGVKDDSEAQSGELVLNVTQAAVDKELWDPLFCNLTVPTLTKTGDGELMMVNVNESSLFTIKDGTVYVYEVQALNSGGLTRVEGPGVLDVSELGEALVNKTIELNNGGTMLVGTDAISGSITAREGTGIMDATGGTANLDAAIGAAQDATLVLQYGRFTLKNAQNNAQGGTIDLQGGTLSLNNAGGVSIGGTLQVSQNATLSSTTGADEAIHVITRLNVADNATLDISGNNKSLLWDIHNLDGNGTINWNAGNSTKSTLMLDGEGSFSGVLNVQGGDSTHTTPGLLLAHERAAQNAAINLTNNASMAVGVENARIGGLNGVANSAVVAYESASGATLTTTGAESYTYNGSIGTASAAMNIVMEGTGSQTYSGTVYAAGVSALNGTLNLQGGNITIAGDVTVARGATIATNSGLTLTEGQYLCSSGVSGAAGVVNGSVTFSGGGLSFDAAGLNGQTAALSFTGAVTRQSGLDVVFTNTNCLTAGSSLLLTSGYDWSGTNFSSSQLEYLEASFSVQGSNLWVNFSQKSGNRIWDGTNQKHAWSSQAFGQGAALSAADTAVFNDSAENQSVQVSGNVSAKALLFDNAKEYAVNTDNGTLTAGVVSLEGSGDVTMGAGVAITQKADIAADSTLVLKDTATLRSGSTVDGDGTVAVDTASTATLDGKLTHIGCVEARSGTLTVGQALAADDMVVQHGAELQVTTGSILAEGKTVHSSGTLQVNIGSGTVALANAVEGGQDGAGSFVKLGAGTLNVTQTLVADTVCVEHGTLKTTNTSMVPGFLETTKRLEVNSGATAYIGGNAYTIPDRPVATEMVVDGGRLELAIAQNTTRTIAGNLTVKNGGTLQKVDGGLIFTGTATLGGSAQDEIILSGNWGKSGTIFNGLVQGEGKVKLAKGNSVEKYTFNNAGNTFSGEIKATAGTQLVAGHKTALAQASNINLENNSTLVLATGAVDIKSLNGSGSVEFSAADDSSSTTLNITDSGTFAGAVGGNISISKSGSNTFALTGESSQFNGDLYVKEGTMSLESGALGILGSASSVTVKENATLHLGGNASVVGPMDIQGTLSLGGNITSRDSVQLAATGHLAGGSHALEANSLVIEGLGGTNVETAASQTLGAGSVLTAFGESADSITLQADAEAMIYVVNNVQDVTLTGESLTINLSGLSQTPRPGQWMGITLGDASHTASIGTGMLVECVIGDGQKMQGYYLSSSSGDSANRVFFQMEEVVSKDLIWDGSSGTNWSNSLSDKNWHAADAPSGSSYFTAGANVQFNSGKNTVYLTDNITAGDMTLVSGADVAIRNGGKFTQEFVNVTIEDGAELSFDGNCITTIGGTLALKGTLVNDGKLSLAGGSVSTGDTGVISGDGVTVLAGSIENAGTVVLDHATLQGGEGASISGNVLIDGGNLLGSMVLGTEGSTVSVTEAFTISGDAEYTVLGTVKLDNLSGAEFYYAEGEQDVDNNGFFIGMDVTVFEMDYEPEVGSPIDFRGTVTYQGMEGSIESGVFTAYVEDYTTFHVNSATEVTETYSHAKAAGGEEFTTVALADGTSFNMDSQGASLAHVVVGDGAEASVNIASTSTIGDAQVGKGLAFTGSGGSLQLTTVQGEGSLIVDGPTVTITGNNVSYSGDIVVNSGTLKAGNNYALGSMDAVAHTISVQTNGTLDVNGLEGTGDGYTVVLAGGTLTNSGGDLGYGKRQLVTHVNLTADSRIDAAKEFGITGGSYAATTVALGDFTLEKKGTGTFHIQNATVTGTGKLKVSQGTLAMSTGPNAGAGSYSANFEMAGGTVSGKVALGGNIAVDTTADSTFGASMNLGNHTATFSGNSNLNATGNISGSGALVKAGAGTLTLGGTNNFSGGTAINGGTLVTNNASALGTGNVSIAAGATLQTRSNLTVGGVISGAGNILADGGGTVTFNAANTFSGSLVVRGVLNEQGQVTTTTTLKMGNNAALGVDTASITIGKGGIVNLNGTSDVCYKYTLAGGALLNNGNGTNTGNKQTAGLTLTADSSFGGSGNFKLLNSVYNAINVSLNGHTLTKTGNNTVGFYTTTFDEGTLEVQGGKLEFNDGSKGANKFSKSAEMVLNVDNSGDADRVSGQVSVVEGLALRAQQSAKASVAVSLSDNATLTTGAEANQTLNMTGAVSGSASTTLAKEGDGTAILTNTGSFRGSVDVEGGILNLMNAASLTVQDVTIAAGATMGVYSNATAAEAGEATLTISGTLAAKGPNGKLNANVVMETGSTLDASATGGAGIALGSSLTIRENIHLSDADFEAVAGLGYGESYILFNGVDSLTLDQTYTEAITPEMQLDAAGWFRGVEPEHIYMVYDGSNVGLYCMVALPEPTTSTLSLLALAALAARRRRK